MKTILLVITLCLSANCYSVDIKDDGSVVMSKEEAVLLGEQMEKILSDNKKMRLFVEKAI